jgi:hypothetical protein
MTKSADYVVWVLATPPNDDTEQTTRATSSSSSSPRSTDVDSKGDKQHYSIDLDWIVNHALQVHDMLVGGMDILGVYCVDTSAQHARQILGGVYKSLRELDYYKKMWFDEQRLLFMLDSKSRK